MTAWKKIGGELEVELTSRFFSRGGGRRGCYIRDFLFLPCLAGRGIAWLGVVGSTGWSGWLAELGWLDAPGAADPCHSGTSFLTHSSMGGILKTCGCFNAEYF
jgi:hypothetical protein